MRAFQKTDNHGGSRHLPSSFGDFVPHLGMTQETLSRKLSIFRDRKLIRLKGQRGIVILDEKGLAAVE